MRDVEDSTSFFNLSCYLVLGDLSQLQTECHVLKYGHVRIQSVVLENHCDISVLRCYIVYESVTDVQLTFTDLLQTCDHSQCCRLTAAGRAYQDYEFLILDLNVEVGNSDNAAGILLINFS